MPNRVTRRGLAKPKRGAGRSGVKCFKFRGKTVCRRAKPSPKKKSSGRDTVKKTMTEITENGNGQGQKRIFAPKFDPGIGRPQLINR